MVVDEINAWLDSSRRAIPEATQLREAAGSITSNIREAYGREIGPDRNKFLRYSRGSAEETDERLRTVVKSRRMPEPFYWRQHHRLVTIIRMLTSLMKRRVPRKRRSVRRKAKRGRR
jgi:four helix bundle protein